MSTQTPILLRDKEAAELIGCSVSTLWRWSANGTIARPLKIGGLARWRISDLEAVVAKAAAERGTT